MRLPFNVEIRKRKNEEDTGPKYISEVKPVQPHKTVDQAMEFEYIPKKIIVKYIEHIDIIKVSLKDKK